LTRFVYSPIFTAGYPPQQQQQQQQPQQPQQPPHGQYPPQQRMFIFHFGIFYFGIFPFNFFLCP
jgi:hypothetical protein